MTALGWHGVPDADRPPHPNDIRACAVERSPAQ